jgi:hypothetical protein
MQWAEGQPLERLTVYMGHHEGVLGLSPNPIITPVLKFDEASKSLRLEGKKFLIVIGRLAVIVAIRVELEGSISGAFLDIANQSDSELNWPAAPPVSYDSYLDIPAQTPSILLQRSMLAHRATRRKAEKLSLKLASLDAALMQMLSAVAAVR